MNILAKALRKADARPADSPEAAAKRASVTKIAHQLYERLRPLSGQIARYQGTQCRIVVALESDRVALRMMKRELRRVKDSYYGNGRKVERPEFAMADTPILLASAWAHGTQDGCVFRDLEGQDKGFAEVGQLEDYVADYIGPHLLLEV